jgi:hypothetical protein
VIVVAEVGTQRVVDYWAYDSRKHTGFVGLKNQGETSYAISLVQFFFFTWKLVLVLFFFFLFYFKFFPVV